MAFVSDGMMWCERYSSNCLSVKWKRILKNVYVYIIFGSDNLKLILKGN